MQLSAFRVVTLLALVGLTTSLAVEALGQAREPRGRATLATSVFHESRGVLETNVIAPSVGLDVGLTDALRLQAGYDVDVVSAASVAVVDGPADVDAITSATWLSDVRHSGRIGVRGRVDETELRAGYRYGTENDYRAHGLSIGIASDFFEHATRLDVGGSLSLDAICDAIQLGEQPVDRTHLGSSTGCFTEERATRSLTTLTLDVGLTQVLRPDLVVQLVVSGQRSEGFQSSPYRDVWLGPWAAQENHPGLRHRGSVALELRYAIPALRSVLGARVRGYADDWSVEAASGEVSLDVGLVESAPTEWTLRVRGRAYSQSAAAFYSDDYANAPRGQYFTGDRELSPMSSLLGGLRLAWRAPSDSALTRSFVSGLRIALAGDVSRATYPDFHLGPNRIPDGVWVLGSLTVEGDIE